MALLFADGFEDGFDGVDVDVQTAVGTGRFGSGVVASSGAGHARCRD